MINNESVKGTNIDLILLADRNFRGSETTTFEKNFMALILENPEAKNVILDLSKIGEIDSKGISLCIGLFKECTKTNRTFKVIAGKEVFKILKAINLDKMILIEEAPDA